MWKVTGSYRTIHSEFAMEDLPLGRIAAYKGRKLEEWKLNVGKMEENNTGNEQMKELQNESRREMWKGENLVERNETALVTSVVIT